MASDKTRVLCLHGFGQNAAILEESMAPIAARLPNFELREWARSYFRDEDVRLNSFASDYLDAPLAIPGLKDLE